MTFLTKNNTALAEYLIDQLPVLAELRRSLEELSLMKPGETAPNIVIEQVFHA
jgi:hypothetical protein